MFQNYDWKYLTKFQKFVVPWSQVTKPFSSHSLFLLKLRNLTKYLRFFPRLGFFVQSQKLNKMKNLSNWEFFLHPNRCTQFSASKLSTLQIANRWRCYHHYVLSCAPSSAKSTKPSLCAYWLNRSLTNTHILLFLFTKFSSEPRIFWSRMNFILQNPFSLCS